MVIRRTWCKVFDEMVYWIRSLRMLWYHPMGSMAKEKRYLLSFVTWRSTAKSWTCYASKCVDCRSYSGLVGDGLIIFERMVREKRIDSRWEHFALCGGHPCTYRSFGRGKGVGELDVGGSWWKCLEGFAWRLSISIWHQACGSYLLQIRRLYVGLNLDFFQKFFM